LLVALGVLLLSIGSTDTRTITFRRRR
jgi:hypothetical protein